MKLLTEAYVGYIPTGSEDNEKCGVKITVLHPKLNPINFNKLNYVRYIANAFSYMISLQAYWSSYRNKHVATIIISDEQLADNIGCHVKHSSKVLQQLKAIFNLEFKRLPEKGGAREITINNRVIEFMKIYDEQQLHLFIEKYELTDSSLLKAIQQLFKYRSWGVSDTSISDYQRETKKTFMKRYKNFYHRAITSFRSDHIRINKVKENKQLLSEKNLYQLERIQEEKKQGKLSWYWMLILVNLEQKVTKLLRKKEKTEGTSEETTKPQTTSESNERPTTAHTRATAAAVKDPEEDNTPGTIFDIMVAFNNMILQQEIPEVKVMSKNHINAISHAVKSIGKEKVLSAINKVPQLIYDDKYKNKITFERFMTIEQINWIHNKIKVEDIDTPEWMAEHLEGMDYDVVKYIDVKSIQEPSTMRECINTYNQLKQA
jgi:hypothetical protein